MGYCFTMSKKEQEILDKEFWTRVADYVQGGKVVIYKRKSTEGQTGASQDISKLEAMIQELGLTVLKTFEETGHRYDNQRPTLQKATEYAKAHGCVGIAVTERARFSNDAVFIGNWEDSHKLLLLPSDTFNTHEIVNSTFDGLNKYEIAEKKRRVKLGYKAAQEKLANGGYYSRKSGGKNFITKFGNPDQEKAQKAASTRNRDKAVERAQELYYAVFEIVTSWGTWKGFEALAEALNERHFTRCQKEKRNMIQLVKGQAAKKTGHTVNGLKVALSRMVKTDRKSLKGNPLPDLLNERQREWIKTEMKKNKARTEAQKMKADYQTFKASTQYREMLESPVYKGQRSIPFADFKSIIENKNAFFAKKLYALIKQALSAA